MIDPNYITHQEAAATIVLDNRSPLGLQRHFRCSVCGNIVFEYSEPLQIIIPGVASPVFTPNVVQCPHSIRVPRAGGDFTFLKCKTRYYIVKRSDIMQLNLDALLASRLLNQKDL